MKNVLFVTGNERKVWQAQTVLQPLGLHVDATEIDIAEIQAHDPLKIAITKAEAAFERLRQPLVICDHYWRIPALKGFPGGYMKDMNRWFEPEDWLAFMKNKQDRSIILTETVVFKDREILETFSVEFPAQILQEVRGKGSNSSERVTAYDGFTETIAERIDAGQHTRDMSKSAWKLFGDWYIKHDG